MDNLKTEVIVIYSQVTVGIYNLNVEVIVIMTLCNWNSNGRKCFRLERCRLTDSVFEKLMNIKYNGHLV